jgi:hypothetical protein
MFRLAHAHSSLLEAINAIDVEADLSRHVICCHCKPVMVVMVVMTILLVQAADARVLFSFSKDFGVDMPMLVPDQQGEW